MKLSKKICGILTLLIAFSIVLAACGGSTPAPSNQSNTPSGSSSSGGSAPTGGGGGTSSQPAADPFADVPKYDIIFHHHEPATAETGVLFDAWAKDVTAATNGKLDITVYPGAILGSQRDTYDLLMNGSVDMAWGTANAHQGSFPISEIMALPLVGFKSNSIASEAFWQLFVQTDYLDKEYGPFKLLALHGCSEGQLALVKDKELNSVADMKNLIVRTSGVWVSQYYTGLGMTPSTIAAGETYTALEKGLLDAVACDWNFTRSFLIYEATPLWYRFNSICSPGFFMMNKDSWEGMPDPLKAVLEEYSYDYLSKLLADCFSTAGEFCEEAIAKQGGRILEPGAQLLAEATAVAEGVWEKWIDEYEPQGYQAREALQWFRNYIATK